MSETAVTILVGAICLLIGVVGGFYLARRNFMNYMEKNPQINEDMVMSMMSQMGQKPSRKKINQVMSNMQKAQKQAQIDWKEDVKFTTKYGEKLSLNVFFMVLSYSRYKIFHVTLSRSQDVLISCITECLEHIEGVPKVIVCDNNHHS